MEKRKITRKVQSIVFYCDANNKKYFLLLKTNLERGNFWQNSTGGVESGESFLEAAIRELSEETEIPKDSIESIIDLKMDFQFIDRWNNDVTERVFAVKVNTPWNVIIDPNEHVEFKWTCEDDITQDSVKFETNINALITVKENRF